MSTLIENAAWQNLDLDDAELQRLLDEPVPTQNTSKLRASADHAGFDENTGDSWIYPTNLPLRSYQYGMTHAALYRNTLVVLPTGLGKTFIAAVVMYNLYRWYPMGKVIFMAPTRPLVAQQIEACQRIMPFPDKDTVELTGKLPRTKRAELWKTKRVFFATPQVVQSDIVASGIGYDEANDFKFPFAQVKLLVIDEAHKAKGRYAYTDVTQAIHQHNQFFRVLALSATPGRTMEDVAEVCRNLYISHLEVRWDASIDVVQYVHRRTMSTIVVRPSDEIRAVREQLLEIIDPYMRQLLEADVLSGSLTNINRNFLLYEQKRFRERSLRERHPEHAAVNSNFSICISLYHALELLDRHGLRVFLQNFEEDEEGRAKYIIAMDHRLRELVESLKRELLGPNPFEVSTLNMPNGRMAPMPENLDFGHPKFEKARHSLLEHFQAHSDSRAIVFCEYRESVMLIYRMLLQHVPLLKPRCFVGQGGTTGSLRALTQKQQIEIMNAFRAGACNVLIATSIGEEGIDVGEVELIVCFDISTSNPTRFVQRIGRTGRKKNGKVVMLVTEGREEQLLRDVLAGKDQINRRIHNSTVVKHALYQNAPRMVPAEFSPQCVKMLVQVADKHVVNQNKSVEKKKPKSKGEKKVLPPKGSQDLRKFFKPPQLDAEELAIFQMPTQAPSTQTQQRQRKYFDKVTDFIDNLNIIPIQTNTQLVAAAAKTPDTRSLKKLTKLWQSTKPILPEAERSTDMHAELRRQEHPQQLKLFVLRRSPAFVQQVCDQMQVLQALDVDIAHNEMSMEEQNIRETYEIIVDVFDGKEALDAFLEDAKAEALREEEENDCDELTDEAFDGLCAEIFDGLHKQGNCYDNYDYIQEEVRKTNYYQQKVINDKSTPQIAESVVYDTMQEELTFGTTVSRCQSQWNDMTELMEHNITDADEMTVESALAKSLRRVSHSVGKNVDDDYHKSKQVVGKAFSSTPLAHKCNSKFVTDSQSHLFSELETDMDMLVGDFKPVTDSMDCKGNQTSWLELAKVEVQHNSTPLAAAATTRSSVIPQRRKFSAATLLDRLVEQSDEANSDDDDVVAVTRENVKQSMALPSSNNSTPENIDTLVADIKSSSKAVGAYKQLSSEKSEKKPQAGLHDCDLSILLEPFESSTTDEEELSPQKSPPAITVIKNEAHTPNTIYTKSTKDEHMMHELDINLDDFLEPFPEEHAASGEGQQKTKEHLLPPSENSPKRLSPDIFQDSISPFKTEAPSPPPNKVSTLVAKLAARSTQIKGAVSSIVPSATRPSTTTASVCPSVSMPVTSAISPQNRKKTENLKYEKSPSLVDLYLQNINKRGQNFNRELLARYEKSTIVSNADAHHESLIVPRKNNAKRKIIDSDEDDNNPEKREKSAEPTDLVTIADEETDVEDTLLATQMPRTRKKRRRLNEFVVHEAAVSGSDQSEDETDLTHYFKDTMIVSSDDDDEEAGAASRTHMQAVYLQSLKSPRTKSRGVFKIPEFRVYNDEAEIYSQPVLPGEQSQYVSDSFVVDEDEVSAVNADVTLCPLERAEQILKQRRRHKQRQRTAVDVAQRRSRRVQIISDSSDED